MRTALAKPEKPRADFLLQAYGNGQWGKRINGVRRYFGPWADPGAAEQRYLRERAAWEAGLDPRIDLTRKPALPRNPALRAIAEQWLAARQLKIGRRGRSAIRESTFLDSKRAIERLLELCGDDADPLAWLPHHFDIIRYNLGAGVGPATHAQRISYARSMFNWAYQNGLLERPVRWGDQFRNVAADEKRAARFTFQKKHGERAFRLEDARRLLREVQERARVAETESCRGGERRAIAGALMLLTATFTAANSGAYAADIGGLTAADLDLDEGLVLAKRTKTSILWQATVWPETVDAWRRYLAVRPAADPGALGAWRRARARTCITPEEQADAMSAEPLLLTAAGFPVVREDLRHDAVLTALGRAHDSEPLLREALRLRRATQGDRHIDTLNAELNLATNLMKLGKLDEAAALLVANARVRKEVMGNVHPARTLPLQALADLRRRQGLPAEAEALFREAFDLAHRALPGNIETLRSRLGLVETLASLGRRDEVDEHLRELASMAEGKDATTRIDAMWLTTYASAIAALDRRDEAIELLRRAVAANESASQPDEGTLQLVQNTLARVAADRGTGASRLPTTSPAE